MRPTGTITTTSATGTRNVSLISDGNINIQGTPSTVAIGATAGGMLNFSAQAADTLTLPDEIDSSRGDVIVAAAQPTGAFGAATLINNAGVIPPIGPLDACPPDQLANALRVGLEAPMQLTAAFLRATGAWVDGGWRGPRKVLNISSGLGRRPMAAQAPYCAAKAGLDHFTRCSALDEAQREHGARLVSLAPGVIDTDMQVQLRAGDPAAFPDLQRFVELQRQGQLSSPPDAARQVLAWLQRPDFGDQPVADVRD